MSNKELQSYTLDWTALKRDAPDWFRDAKFGLFFHWAPYCVPACENEWYSRNMYARGLSQNRHHIETYGELRDFGYKDFYDLFTGESFDPENWAELIKASGARYAGPVAEHADNFSLWNSRINPVNSVNYGPHRDVVGEIRKSIVDRGIRFAATFHHQWLWGWFMSTDPDADVYDPQNEPYYGKALPLETNRYIPWRLPDAEFNRTWMEKVVEVIQAYDPDLVYFDSRALIIDEAVRKRTLEYCYLGPSGRSDRVVTFKQTDFPEGTGVVDIECGRFAELHGSSWQTDDRLEARRTWCHVKDPEYKSATTIIHQLIDVVSKNGNLLLNVGPRVDGTFEPEAEKTLRDIGSWLATFGEAIYETRPFAVYGEGGRAGSEGFDVTSIEAQTKTGVIGSDEAGTLSPGDIRFTTHDNVIYVLLPHPPEDSVLHIASLGTRGQIAGSRIEKVALIEGPDNLGWEQRAESLDITLPRTLPSRIANVVKVTISSGR